MIWMMKDSIYRMNSNLNNREKKGGWVILEK